MKLLIIAVFEKDMDPDVVASDWRVGHLVGGGPTLWKGSLWLLPLGSLGVRCKTSPGLWSLVVAAHFLVYGCLSAEHKMSLNSIFFFPVFIL